MKYLEKSFSSGANTKEYREGWDKVFEHKEKIEEEIEILEEDIEYVEDEKEEI